MMTKLLSTLSFFFSFSCILLSQVTLSGSISDGLEPLPFCNVILLDTDSIFIIGAVSDDSGNFTLETVSGTYLLKVTYIGFEDHIQKIQLMENRQVEVINLKPMGTELDEITVTAQKRLIEQKSDRLVFNMGNSIAARGTDLSKAISLAPGVIVQNNALNIVGRGSVAVMVNGRLLPLEGADLMTFLSSISSDDIEKVEVITNPPAQYDAAGNAGLINIIYKKGRNNSWKNTTTLSYTKNREGFGDLRNSLQYNRDKHQISLSLNAGKGKNWNTEYGATFFPDADQSWESIYTSGHDQVGGRLAYDYQWTDKTSIGFQYQGSAASPNSQQNTSTQLSIKEVMQDTTFINTNLDDRDRQSHVANVHLVTSIDSTDKQLSIDLDYFSYDQKSNAVFDINAFNFNEESLGLVRARSTTSEQNIKNYSLKIDMVHPTSIAKLSYGIKYNRNIAKNEIINYNRLSGLPVLDTNLSNTFEYEEDISAAYFSASRQLSDQWNIQLGLRLEYTASSGYSASLNQRNDNQYKKLFPTFYLGYQPDDEHQYSFSIGGRINRASFRDLNPFRIYITNTSFSEGNPFLQPSNTYTFNFNYVFKSQFTTSLYYNRARNGFGTLFVPSPSERVLATLRDNYYNGDYLGIGEIFSIDISNRWSMQNQVYLMYNHTTVYDNYAAKAQNGFQYYLSNNHNINFGNGWQCQLNMWYNSSWKSNIFSNPAQWRVDLSISKKMLDDQLQISLQINDLFETSNLERLASEINGVLNTYGQNYSSRNVQLTLSYSLGNDKINLKKRKFGNEEEQRRW